VSSRKMAAGIALRGKLHKSAYIHILCGEGLPGSQTCFADSRWRRPNCTRAVNQAMLHRWAMKPWAPAEERIVPVLTPL
jgi:hypothetical protein